MITLTQLGLGGGGSSLGDTIYRHGEGTRIIREDGSVFIRSGALLPYNVTYESSRLTVPYLFQKNTRPLSVVHTGDFSIPSSPNVYYTQFFHANDNFYAVSQSTATGKMSVASNLTSSYSAVTNTPAGTATWVTDFIKLTNNTIVVSGSHLDGVTSAVKLGSINTTNNTFVAASSLAAGVPVGLLASNGTSAVFRGVSTDSFGQYTSGANVYHTNNGTTWTQSPISTNLPNPMVWFWSPAAGKYLCAVRRETIVIEDSGFVVPVLDENGSNVSFNYMALWSSSTGYDNWSFNDRKPGASVTGDLNRVSNIANVMYHYKNDISYPDYMKYPASSTYIYRTQWQSLYANSPTASIFSPNLYQAIARTTDGVECDIIDLSGLLNDPVKTAQRILVAWDGARFLAFYGDTVLYSLDDGITWQRTPHLIYSAVPTVYGTQVATAPSAVSVVNNRLVASYLGFLSPYIPFTYAAEFTNGYLANTTPDTMGPITANWIGSGTIAYSYTRIK